MHKSRLSADKSLLAKLPAIDFGNWAATMASKLKVGHTSAPTPSTSLSSPSHTEVLNLPPQQAAAQSTSEKQYNDEIKRLKKTRAAKVINRAKSEAQAEAIKFAEKALEVRKHKNLALYNEEIANRVKALNLQMSSLDISSSRYLAEKLDLESNIEHLNKTKRIIPFDTSDDLKKYNEIKEYSRSTAAYNKYPKFKLVYETGVEKEKAQNLATLERTCVVNKQKMKDLDEALDIIPSHAETTYSGQHAPVGTWENIEVDDIVTNNTYMSTSKSYYVAHDFAKVDKDLQERVIFIVKGESGKNITLYSTHNGDVGGEAELLFKRDKTFIVRHKRKKGKIWFVFMDEVTGNIPENDQPKNIYDGSPSSNEFVRRN